MNMKLSYRDKVIFIVVIVIVILIAGFFLLIRPKFQDVDAARAAYEAKQQEKTDIDTKISTLPQLIEDMKTSAQEVGEQQELFLTEQDPYLNETYVKEALESLNLRYASITTEYAEANPITRYTVAPPETLLAYDNKMNADLYHELPQEIYDKYLGTAAAGYPESIVGETKMTVVFYGDMQLDDVYNVIDRLSEDDKAVILNSVASGDITEENTDGDVTFTCEITVYNIFPLNVDKVMEENDDWQQYLGQTPAAAEETA